MTGVSRSQRREGQQTFDALAADFQDRPEVDQAPMFGSLSLRVHGKVFAFVGTAGELVIKLPADQATELVATGTATRMRIGRNPAREWVGVPPDEGAPDLWRRLLDDAYRYVSSLHGG